MTAQTDATQNAAAQRPLGQLQIGALTARLALLLPGLDDGQRAPIARAVELHVQHCVSQCWARLVQRCAAALPPGPAAILLRAADDVPEADTLPRLDRVITPSVLLSLQPALPPTIIVALLAHADVLIQEQTLDALEHVEQGCLKLVESCSAWVRRMFLARLGNLPALRHVDRLSVEELLLAGERDADAAKPMSLIQALQEPDDHGATLILSERAGVPLVFTETAIRQRDARTLLSLCWKAGCSREETHAVQIQLGGILPDQALLVGPDDRWPLDAAAMQWRIAVPD